MTEINSLPSLLEADTYSKRIKRALDNSREFTLFVNSVLLWRKTAYPWAIFAVISFLFMELAYYDPSFLTMISLVFLFFNLLDYFGPLVISTIWKQENWSAAKERELEDICKSLAHCYLSFKHSWNSLMEIKTKKPNLYYPSAFISSCMLAWVGNNVNNFFLTYLLVLFVLMLPALSHYGLIHKYYNMGLAYAMNSLKGYSGAKSKVQ
ncbi:ADP-ribosylation factor-like protein 6-interacting protein 1 [Cimex lectularius]|uniref:RETREG1-3/ARL6IP-like N-terminal reticulon-homology domain-containing protein n=1 Tax=Cimex lectularius TaxID=79782 RepID=A0A8I6SNA6_CIMLE|nr:ADP-ribosylation factor-like protein 6-interacting protein 1 [Cimex lectularius]